MSSVNGEVFNKGVVQESGWNIQSNFSLAIAWRRVICLGSFLGYTRLSLIESCP